MECGGERLKLGFFFLSKNSHIKRAEKGGGGTLIISPLLLPPSLSLFLLKRSIDTWRRRKERGKEGRKP